MSYQKEALAEVCTLTIDKKKSKHNFQMTLSTHAKKRLLERFGIGGLNEADLKTMQSQLIPENLVLDNCYNVIYDNVNIYLIVAAEGKAAIVVTAYTKNMVKNSIEARKRRTNNAIKISKKQIEQQAQNDLLDHLLKEQGYLPQAG
jgi:hypothetical protein